MAAEVSSPLADVTRSKAIYLSQLGKEKGTPKEEEKKRKGYLFILYTTTVGCIIIVSPSLSIGECVCVVYIYLELLMHGRYRNTHSAGI
jgi:hypothetical protein